MRTQEVAACPFPPASYHHYLIQPASQRILIAIRLLTQQRTDTGGQDTGLQPYPVEIKAEVMGHATLFLAEIAATVGQFVAEDRQKGEMPRGVAQDAGNGTATDINADGQFRVLAAATQEAGNDLPVTRRPGHLHGGEVDTLRGIGPYLQGYSVL